MAGGVGRRIMNCVLCSKVLPHLLLIGWNISADLSIDPIPRNGRVGLQVPGGATYILKY
jgi:hypothetical protein